jgi:hypothetical protein
MPSLHDLLSSNNLSGMVNSILTLPHNTNLKAPLPIYPEEEEHRHIIPMEEEGSSIYSNLKLKIGGKGKKQSNKKKQIDTYTKDKLVKMAKKHDIKLSSKGVKRTKIQLFNSLKRKKLI